MTERLTKKALSTARMHALHYVLRASTQVPYASNEWYRLGQVANYLNTSRNLKDSEHVERSSNRAGYRKVQWEGISVKTHNVTTIVDGMLLPPDFGFRSFRDHLDDNDPFVSELPVHDPQNDTYEELLDWTEVSL